MQFVTNIEPPRANHFFERKNDTELIIAFGFDQQNNVPLNDFKVYNIETQLTYNACIDFNFLPEYNMSWTGYKSEYIIIYGGKVNGLLMVVDINQLENSVLQ